MTEENNKNRDVSDIYSSPVTDGLTNVVSGLGTSKARDPSSFLNRDMLLDRTELEDIYRFYWISKAVDIKPWDMTREGRTFSGEGVKPLDIKKIETEEQRTELWSDVRTALIWASVYGGGAIVMHINGQGDMSEELDVTKVKQGQLSHLTSLDRWELLPAQGIDFNPLSQNFGRSRYYRVATDTQGNLIHRSRIVFFNGRKMPIRITRQLWGWGDPEIQRWYKAITNSETLAAGIIEGVHQANIDVVATKGLKETLAMKDGEKKIKDRFMLLDYCKSLLNMAVIDGEDVFSRNSFSFAGLPEIYNVFLQVLASATDIPVTRLLGSSPGGLSATGESDTRNYYDSIKSGQENNLKPKLNIIDQVLVRSALGYYPETLEYEFNSLWQLSEQEQADLDGTRVNTLATLIGIGVPENVVLLDAIEHGLVKNLTKEDIEEMEEEIDVDEGNDDFIPEEKSPPKLAPANTSSKGEAEGSILKTPSSVQPKIAKVT
jgi:hypothetical protein